MFLFYYVYQVSLQYMNSVYDCQLENSSQASMVKDASQGQGPDSGRDTQGFRSFLQVVRMISQDKLSSYMTSRTPHLTPPVPNYHLLVLSYILSVQLCLSCNDQHCHSKEK